MIFSTPEFTISDAMESESKDKWIEAFKMEYGAILKTGTFQKITDETQCLLDERKLKVHQT